MRSFSLEALAAQAERILGNKTREELTLSGPVLVAQRDRSLVVRCAVTGPGEIESVVIKRSTGDDARGFTDWASLEFLSRLEAADGVAPRFYAGDPSERVLVMEDLGGSCSLEDLLEKGNGASVRQALRAMAVPMARLVAATAGRESEFREIRRALPGAEGLGREREAERWLGGFEQIRRWAQALGIRLPIGFRDAFGRVAEVYAQPGPYLAFSHGDPAPSNNHISRERVRLVDFEYAGYRHALYDLTGWNVLCPLPAAWVRELESSFRRSLAAGPARALVADDKQYREAWAAMCAYRALAMLTWFPPALIEEDRPWVASWTMRAAAISTVLRLREAAGGVAWLEPLARFGASMAEALHTLWPKLRDGAIRWPALER